VERTTIAGETEVLGENLPQRHFLPPQIPHDQVRFRTPDRSGGKPATNRLSYGAAFVNVLTCSSNELWGIVLLSFVSKIVSVDTSVMILIIKYNIFPLFPGLVLMINIYNPTLEMLGRLCLYIIRFCLMRKFIICTLRQIQWSSQGGWDGQGL
jgi:hypothetical protein